jgi:hemerythrin-like metal-binding protein
LNGIKIGEKLMTEEKILAQLEWTEILSVGIPEIDEDHKELLSMLNNCVEITNGIKQDKNLDPIFNDLMKYTKYHFQHEEQMLTDLNYPFLEKHKKVHQWLIKEVQRRKREYEQDKLTLESLIDFITNWLKDHIMSMDKSAFTYCNGDEQQKTSIVDNKVKILLVDDEKEIHKLLNHALIDYNIISTYSGTQALEVISTQKVDIILLDVSMSGLNGYETCKQIRAQESETTIPIIFLSGKTSLEDIIKGYESGGTDYLSKPFKLSELRAKIAVEIKNFNLEKNLQSNLSEVTEAVLNVQNTNAKIYSICRFLQKSFFCKDIASLCQLFFTVTQSFGTQAIIYIHSQESPSFYNSQGKQHAMSNAILEQVRSNEGRIFQFGKDRAIFNWELVSVLVNNLGDDVDNLALLMDGFEMGLKAIQASNDFETILTDYKELKHNQCAQVTQAFEEVIFEIQDELNRTGYDSLSEEQENALIRIVESKSDKVDCFFNQSLKLDEELSNVMSKLRTDNSSTQEGDNEEIDFL